MSAPLRQNLPALRLPLQTGHALFNVLVAIGLIHVVCIPLAGRHRTEELFWLIWAVTLALGGLVFFRFRASDIVLDAGGLRVLGGRYHDLARSWSELSGSTCNVQRHGLGYALWLRGDFAMFVPLATTFSHREAQSLEALVSSLRTWDDRHTRPRAPAAGVTLFCCNACGAPLVPVDSPHATCRYCGGSVPVPPWVTELVRASQQRNVVDPLDEREVRDVLRQRSAFTINAFVVVVLVALAGLPWGIFLADNVFAFASLAALVTLFLLLRALLADRQAMVLLTLGFGARAPRAAGAPHDCRVCGAPLPDVPGSEQLVWRCLYCHSDNIVGLELAAESSVASTERRGLRAALRGRRTERFLILLATLGLVAGVLFLTVPELRNPVLESLDYEIAIP